MRAALLLSLCAMACESSSQCLRDAAEAITCEFTTGACDDTRPCDHSLECENSQCQPHAFEPLALRNGFNVDGMQISLGAGLPPQVIWHSPHDAEVVSCALFLCNPMFVRAGCSPNGDRERHVIANFDQCVLLFRASAAEQTVFELVDGNAPSSGPVCEGATIGRHIVTKLAAGCWAYDTTKVIAASELLPVSGRLLSSLSLTPHAGVCQPSQPNLSTDGIACYDDAADRFGACMDDVCASYCRSDTDCTQTSSPGQGTRCKGIPGIPLGACGE